MNEELISLLSSFISFKSTAESQIQKQECLDWIASTFLGEDFAHAKRGVFESSPWLYVHNPKSKLLVFAHIDVVPGREEQFQLVVDGDRAIGRGTSDMKGNILPLLMAYRDAQKTNENELISLLITSDEEVGGYTIPHLLEEGIIKDSVAYTPDANHKGIVVEHKGSVWVEVTAQGKGGHGAYPWDAVNPNILLADALVKIQKAFPNGGHDDWHITVTPTSMHGGGSAHNQIPSAAKAGLDIRYPASLYSSIDKVLDEVRAVLPEGCTAEKIFSMSPLSTPNDHPSILLFKEVAEKMMGAPIPFKREHGGTDARYFSERGIPAFLYGPEGAGLHGDNEWVSISSLEKHYEMYRELFRQL